MSPQRRLAIDPIPLPPGIAAATVLIADEDPYTIDTLQPSLEAGGYHVLTTDSGQEALDLFDEHYPHAVLLGSRLGDMDGKMVCRTIKTESEPGFTPVIALAEAGHALTFNGTEYLADAVLAKPVQRETLLEWLTSLLRIKWQFDRVVRDNARLAAASGTVDILKSEIIASVSHELRTPLVQIKAAVALLAEDIEQSGRHEQARLADMATQAVARLESAVENIRQLAQTHRMRREAVSVNEAVDLAIRHLERSWLSCEAADRVQRHLEDRLPLVVADKRALARLLQLLLDNALKFSPNDSPVYVIAQRTSGRQVWVGVQDFGIGIAEEDQAHIFDAFYQVDGSTTRRYGGTGSGLALARLLADGMNTTINLDSVLHEGSTFFFTLPIANLPIPDDA